MNAYKDSSTFTFSFVFSLTPIYETSLSLNVYANNVENKANKKIIAQCNRISDDDARAECLEKSEEGKKADVGVGQDENYKNAGKITENTGDDLWWEVQLLFFTCLMSTVANLLFMVQHQGYLVPSSYPAVLSGVVFVMVYYFTEGSVGEVLEDKIEALQDSVAAKLKFEFTGDQAADTDTYNLLSDQKDNLTDAAEMLQDLESGAIAATVIMWVAAVLALVEWLICLTGWGSSMPWCSVIGVTKTKAPSKDKATKKETGKTDKSKSKLSEREQRQKEIKERSTNYTHEKSYKSPKAKVTIKPKPTPTPPSPSPQDASGRWGR